MKKYIRKFLVILTVLVTVFSIWLIFYIPHYLNFDSHAWYILPYIFTAIIIIYGEIALVLSFSINHEYESK